MSGRVPQELVAKYNKDIGVSLTDKRKEDYVPPPPPKYISFSGEGTSMGGGVQATGGAVNTAETGGKPAVDPDKPHT